MQTVARVDNEHTFICEPVTASVSSAPIPSSLFAVPGHYSYNGKVYDWTVPGVYCFLNPGVDGGHRIVHQSDPHTLMKSLAEICVYGNDDNATSYSTRLSAAKTRKLRMQCGDTTQFVRDVCTQVGIPARTVRALTTVPNGWDEGHVMPEVKVNGQWRVYDLPGDVMMTDDCDEPIPASALLDTDDWSSEQLVPFRWDADAGGSNQFHPGIYASLFFRSPAMRLEWQKRIFQIIGIDDGGLTYWVIPPGHEHLKSWVEGLSSVWRVIPRAEWDARFYC